MLLSKDEVKEYADSAATSAESATTCADSARVKAEAANKLQKHCDTLTKAIEGAAVEATLSEIACNPIISP